MSGRSAGGLRMSQHEFARTYRIPLATLKNGYFFYAGSYVDDILKVLDPPEKTIVHIPNGNARESTKDKSRKPRTSCMR
jgi:hypothetical protein